MSSMKTMSAVPCTPGFFVPETVGFFVAGFLDTGAGFLVGLAGALVGFTGFLVLLFWLFVLPDEPGLVVFRNDGAGVVLPLGAVQQSIH